MTSIAEQLEGSPLFKGVDLPDREALVQLMRRQSYLEGAVLFKKDDAGDTLYIILSGRIRIYTYDSEGRELTLRHYGPGEMFGEFALLDQRPRSASAAAAEPLEVLELSRDDFLAFLRERPLVGLAMMRHLVERVRYTTEYLQVIMDATQRLSQGDYEQALQQVPVSSNDANIQKLIKAFYQMVRSVRARQQPLTSDNTDSV